MQVTIGSQCWDGFRRKSVIESARIEVLQQRILPAARLDSMLKAILSFSAVPITLLTAMSPHAFAASIAPEAVPAMSTALSSKILHAFDPLIHLIQSLSYPIAGVMIAGGCLFIMVGNREQGMKMLQNAAIGYILVQLSPMLLKLLVGVGEGV